MLKILIFTNCHGEYYKNILKKYTNISIYFEIKYIISYENLNNFKNIKENFENADIILINPIENYIDFRLENIKKIIKKDCKLIVIPFIRFEGFWLEDKYLKLKKFQSNIIQDFPNIDLNSIDNYLDNSIFDINIFKDHFNNSVNKLKEIENKSDILFVDFFLNNYKKYPMFKDINHPTINILQFIASQIIGKINEIHSIDNKFKYSLQITIESGHFKPITNTVKKILNLEYDLDSYYRVSRKDYLTKILEYDNNDNHDNISDFNQFYNKVFYNILGIYTYEKLIFK
jgi:hypothetical protein